MNYAGTWKMIIRAPGGRRFRRSILIAEVYDPAIGADVRAALVEAMAENIDGMVPPLSDVTAMIDAELANISGAYVGGEFKANAVFPVENDGGDNE